MSEILSISKKLPKETTLPDGKYFGTWGGYIIDLRWSNVDYELKTKEGVRGIGFKVVVTVVDGKATFDEINN